MDILHYTNVWISNHFFTSDVEDPAVEMFPFSDSSFIGKSKTSPTQDQDIITDPEPMDLSGTNDNVLDTASDDELLESFDDMPANNLEPLERDEFAEIELDEEDVHYSDSIIY